MINSKDNFTNSFSSDDEDVSNDPKEELLNDCTIDNLLLDVPSDPEVDCPDVLIPQKQAKTDIIKASKPKKRKSSLGRKLPEAKRKMVSRYDIF